MVEELTEDGVGAVIERVVAELFGSLNLLVMELLVCWKELEEYLAAIDTMKSRLQ